MFRKVPRRLITCSALMSVVVGVSVLLPAMQEDSIWDGWTYHTGILGTVPVGAAMLLWLAASLTIQPRKRNRRRQVVR